MTGTRRELAGWRRGRAAVIGLALVAGELLGGCAGGRSVSAGSRPFEFGDFARARSLFVKEISNDRSDRDYILSRMRAQIATLADGYPQGAEELSNQAFDLLRTQGLNADKTTTAVVLHEGVKTWKGEPFEQAMSYTYIAVQKAMLGEWDNARAAAGSSLFLLKDFADNEKPGENPSSLELAQRAQSKGEEYLDKGYVPIRTDFALGYLLSGVASKAIGREDEARDNFNAASEANAGLIPLAEALTSDGYNTLFVVDFGIGPKKVAYGPDDALARFMPRTQSDDRGISAMVVGGGGVAQGPQIGPFPPVCDVNQMAQSHLWNNLEDVRIAKSQIGSALMTAGIVVAGTANSRNSDARANQQIIGLGMAIIGGLLRAGAAADTRSLDVLPQRVYLIPVRIDEPDSIVRLSLGATERMVLPAMSPPREDRRIQLRYVRLAERASREMTGEVLYANDQCRARVEGDDLPYILGGRCVRHPSLEVLTRYQQAGWLTGMTVVDLENLYREEGITLTAEDAHGMPGVHILMGGTTLVEPLAGTVGYVEAFTRLHSAYRPKSDRVREVSKQIAAELERRRAD